MTQTNKINITLFTPHPKQREIINTCLDPKIKWVICAISRQFGKSLMAENLLIYWALKSKGQTCMWISPTDAQVQKVYKEIASAVLPTNLVQSQKASSGDAEIIFTNGSKILFRSAHSENNLRGYAVNYMIIDEAAFVKRTTIEEIILPMLTVKGKKCLFLSTPKGKNWFWEYYQMAPTLEGWAKFRFTAYDSPLIDEEFIDNQKKILSDSAFAQEYLAEFVDSASIFQNISGVLKLKHQDRPIGGEKYWCGIDIGLLNDASVLSLINSDGDCITFFKWVETPVNQLLLNIEEILRVWQPQRTQIEVNGVGEPIYQLLKDKIKGIYPWTTNNKNKSEIISNLVAAFKMNEIQLPDDPDLRDELEAFQYKTSDTGVVRYAAGEGAHDDIIMSIAIARETWAKFGHITNYKSHYKLY